MYKKDKATNKVRLVLQDGSCVEGSLEIFQGSRLTDMLNAQYQKLQFVKIIHATVTLPSQKVFPAPWVLVNRYSVRDYTEL